jgi:hypothetical protein
MRLSSCFQARRVFSRWSARDNKPLYSIPCCQAKRVSFMKTAF